MTTPPTDEITRCIEYAGDDGAFTDEANHQLSALIASNELGKALADAVRRDWLEGNIYDASAKVREAVQAMNAFDDAITKQESK